MKWKLLLRLQTVALAGGLALLATRPATAQTAENTIITNTATVSWTDANAFGYTPVSGSVSVTVGFQGGLSVTPDGGSQSPASSSTGNTLALTVQNVGNGVDTVQVAESITGDASVISVTNYNWNSTDYGTDVAALNTALATYQVTAGASTVITVTYNVPADKGGLSANYQLTATSVRGAGSNPGDYDISPGETFAVAVTPDGAQNLQQLPSGSNYTFTFTVQNNGNGAEDFDLLARPGVPGTVITIVSVNGATGDSTRISALAAGSSTTIDVIYSVGDVSALSVDSVYLKARSVGQPATLDEGFADLTVIRANVTITKAAYTNAGLTTLVSGDVLPGDTIWYKVTVSNTSGAGTAAASSIDVDDDLPSEVSYVTHGDDGAGWTITKSGASPEHIDATLPSLAQGDSKHFWIEVTIN